MRIAYAKPGTDYVPPCLCALTELIIPFQTHGTDSLIIDDTYLNATHSERQAMLQGIDALITRMPGCCICISTADCIPRIII